jgi:hypothetical protein
MEEQRKSVMALAKRENWGALKGTRVLGNRVIYTFESGAQASVTLPPGSTY